MARRDKREEIITAARMLSRSGVSTFGSHSLIFCVPFKLSLKQVRLEKLHISIFDPIDLVSFEWHQSRKWFVWIFSSCPSYARETATENSNVFATKLAREEIRNIPFWLPTVQGSQTENIAALKLNDSLSLVVSKRFLCSKLFLLADKTR